MEQLKGVGRVDLIMRNLFAYSEWGHQNAFVLQTQAIVCIETWLIFLVCYCLSEVEMKECVYCAIIIIMY